MTARQQAAAWLVTVALLASAGVLGIVIGLSWDSPWWIPIGCIWGLAMSATGLFPKPYAESAPEPVPESPPAESS